MNFKFIVEFNAWPVTAVADKSGLNFLCQNKNSCET